MLERRLLQAEREVAKGEQLLEQQRAIVAVRRRDGGDVLLPSDVLEEMEATQRQRVADRDRLSQELGRDLNVSRMRRRLQRRRPAKIARRENEQLIPNSSAN